MSAMHAQAAVMEQVAARFDDAHDSLRGALSSLLREVEAVGSDWQGRGAASFEQVSRAWAEDQERLLRALSETAAAIRGAGHTYTSTDDEAAGRLRYDRVALPL
jgi:WXG100 family type VII secretion target